jgi:hypothetical protein
MPAQKLPAPCMLQTKKGKKAQEWHRQKAESREVEEAY